MYLITDIYFEWYGNYTSILTLDESMSKNGKSKISFIDEEGEEIVSKDFLSNEEGKETLKKMIATLKEMLDGLQKDNISYLSDTMSENKKYLLLNTKSLQFRNLLSLEFSQKENTAKVIVRGVSNVPVLWFENLPYDSANEIYSKLARMFKVMVAIKANWNL